MLSPSFVSTPFRQGESFESWLRRFAFLRNCEVGALLRHLDCDRFANNPDSVWLWGIGERSVRRVAEFSRVEPDEICSSELAATIVDLFPYASNLRQLVDTAWVSVGTLRFCTLCLTEQQFFARSWQFGFVVACEKHGVLLTFGCGSCGRVRWSPLTHPPVRDGGVLDIARCPNCRSWLTDVKPVAASASVLDAHQTIVNAMAGDGDLFGQRVPPAVWVDALSSMAALVTLSKTTGRSAQQTWSRQQRKEHGSRDGARRALLSDDPAQAADVLPQAVDALASRAGFDSLIAGSIRRLKITAHEPTASALLSVELYSVWASEEIAPSTHYPSGRRRPKRSTENKHGSDD